MNVLVVTNIWAYCEDGKVYLPEQLFYIVKRYSEFFGKVNLFSRIASTKPNTKLIDSSEYVDKLDGYSKKFGIYEKKVRKQLDGVVGENDLIICRCPSSVGCYAGKFAKRRNKKLFAEVMGDAGAALWYHSFAGKLMAPFMYLRTRNMVKKSDYALYVTKNFLQNSYPSHGITVGCSDVKINRITVEEFEKRKERISGFGTDRPIAISTIGAANVKYKGHAYAIKALSRLKKQGFIYKYTIIGGGSQERLKKLAERLGVVDEVVFAGRCSMDEVFRLLDETDIYVHPSLTEGMPRSVLEAQSRGCAVIGTAVSGIPEILPKENLFGKGDVSGIVRLLKGYTVEKLQREADYNIKFVEKFLLENSDEVRNAFFSEVKKDLENRK